MTEMIDCPWCGGVTRPVQVGDRGSYICPRCRRELMDDDDTKDEEE